MFDFSLIIEIFWFNFLLMQTLSAGVYVEGEELVSVFVSVSYVGLFFICWSFVSVVLHFRNGRNFISRMVIILLVFCAGNLVLGGLQASWKRSVKEHNRLMHSLNGNIFRLSVLITVLIVIFVTVPLFVLELICGGEFGHSVRNLFSGPFVFLTLIRKFFTRSKLTFVLGAVIFALSPVAFLVIFFTVTVFEVLTLLRPKVAWMWTGATALRNRPRFQAVSGASRIWKRARAGVVIFRRSPSAPEEQMESVEHSVPEHFCDDNCTLPGCLSPIVLVGPQEPTKAIVPEP